MKRVLVLSEVPKDSDYQSFAKSVNLKKERAERTIPSVEATGILR